MDDDSPISSFGVPVTIRDFALSADRAWKHVDTYADCNEAGDCARILMCKFGPLAPPKEPVGKRVSLGIVEGMLEEQNFAGWLALPEELKDDPSLNALLKTGDQYDVQYDTRESFGRAVA